MLAEEVGFGFLLERGLEHSGPGAPDTFGPSQRDLFGLLARILVNGDERGNAFAFGELAANNVAGTLRGDHNDINILGWGDGFEMNGEAVAEEQGFPLGQIGSDILPVNRGNLGVRHGNKDDVGLLDRVGRVENREAFLLGYRAAFAARVEADDDLHAAFFEVEGVGVAL